MKRSRTGAVLLVFLAAVFFASSASAQLSAKLGDRVTNWTRPMQLTTEADKTPPRLFIGVDPCRIVDTRGAAGPYGAPALTGGVPRNFALRAGPCAGLPTTIDAYSLNITVVNAVGPGFILIYPQGGAQPTVSTLNYVAGQVVANAAIVPAGTGAGVTVIAGVSGTDLIIDINGYFSSVLGTPTNFFRLDNNSDGFTMLLHNFSTTCGGPCGIYQAVNGTGATTAILGVSNGAGAGVGVQGQSNGTANGAAGVEGDAFGTTGVVYGVAGSTASPTPGAAGVYGTGPAGAASGTSNLAAGVRGSAGGASGIGVQGDADNAGVRGEVYNGSGGFLALGILGFKSGVNSYGVWSTGDYGGSGAKYFVEPHPTDASRVIRYIALEGPESGTYFRGTARTVKGEAVIEVPESFRIVSDEENLTVQLTPVGTLTTMAVMSQDLNQIVVRSSRDVSFHYFVLGVRRAFKGFEPIVPGGEFAPWSPKDVMAASLPEEAKRRLVANGTYNPDGTVNMATAERMGWAQKWRDDEAKAKAAQEAAAANAK